MMNMKIVNIHVEQIGIILCFVKEIYLQSDALVIANEKLEVSIYLQSFLISAHESVTHLCIFYYHS